MKLHFKTRAGGKKSALGQERRAGFIPAIIYHKEKDGEIISVNKTDFGNYLRAIKPGHLPTTVFTLVSENGKERKALVKDIQYFPINYDVIHLDFEELHDQVPVKVKVPVTIVGEADSVGIKLGGVVRIVIRHIRVQCLPKDMPKEFVINVKDMELGKVKKAKELEIPNNVRPLVKMEEVVITMVKR